MFVAIFGGSAGARWRSRPGRTIGGRFAAVPFLWWPALFCSLGFNFLQYGIDSPFGDGARVGLPHPGRPVRADGRHPARARAQCTADPTGADWRGERIRRPRLAAGLRPDAASAARVVRIAERGARWSGGTAPMDARSAAEAWSAGRLHARAGPAIATWRAGSSAWPTCTTVARSRTRNSRRPRPRCCRRPGRPRRDPRPRR